MHSLDPDTHAAAVRFIAMAAQRYDIVSAWVYGSRARGTHRADSDVDLAVLLRGEHQRFMSAKLNMADMAFDVLLETGRLISPLPIWQDEWDKPHSHANPQLLQNIQREGIRV